MQPSLPQDARFNYSAMAEVMQKYLNLSDRATGPQSTGVRDAQILIWPESAFPFFLTREADAMAQIADLLPKGTVLITGAVRAPDVPPGVKITRAYNSIYIIDHDGSVLSVYDKLHLVPFGEYLPFQDLMEKLGFEQLTKVSGGFIPGSRRKPMDVPGAPRMLPLICYEAVFPGDVAARDDRPGWIVNLTNDGWFGISTGPYQHLQQARLRTIEEGLPLVRAANTGVSAVIDPVGRIVARLGLGTEGVLDSPLPSAIPPTIYARLGDISAAVLVAPPLIIAIRPPYFLPVSGRQNLARNRDFDADDMAFRIEIVEERPGFLGPLDLAADQRDIHGVGFGIVGYLRHGLARAPVEHHAYNTNIEFA